MENEVAEQITLYPNFVVRGGSTFLHDPLAAMAILRPDLLGWKPYNIQVELTGTLTKAMPFARTPDYGHLMTARVAMGLDQTSCQAFGGARIAN